MASENATYYRLINDDGALFWLLQVTGWVGISLLTYLEVGEQRNSYPTCDLQQPKQGAIIVNQAIVSRVFRRHDHSPFD